MIMADITMCFSENEEGLCKDCYRRIAKANPFRQAYFIQIPLLVDGTCDEYYRILTPPSVKVSES